MARGGVRSIASLMARVRLLLAPMAVMAVSRVLVFSALASATLVSGHHLSGYLRAWDGQWYELIATDGYPDHVYGSDGRPIGLFAFFPVYPLLVRGLHQLTFLNVGDAASIVSLAAALLLAALLWTYVRDLTDASTAGRTVALFAFFPGAFVLTLHYSDGVMLCAAVGCLLALHRRQWVVAGLAGAVCTAARPNGVVIVACCAFVAVNAVRRQRDWRAVLAPLLAPVGGFVHFLYLWRLTGHVFPWYVAEHEGWHDEFKVDAVVERMKFLWNHQMSDRQGYVIAAMLLFSLVMFVLLVRARLPGEVLVWTIGILVLALGSSVLGLRPRFVMTAFPLLIPLAARLRSEMAFALTIAVFACSQVTLAVLTALGVYLLP
jgi:hypothetical protein